MRPACCTSKGIRLVLVAILGLQGNAWAEAGKLYWTTGGIIMRADLDGLPADSEPLVTGPPWATDIGLDPVDGKVYWTDTHGGIHRVGQDGSGVEDLLDGAGRGIALDGQRRKMYWRSGAGIQRANLDGSSVETLVTTEGYPESLVLDPVDAKMYWIGYGGDENGPRIRRADLDGTSAEDLAVVLDDGWPQNLRGLSLDLTGRKIYWMGDSGYRETIYRADLDGSDVEDLLPPIALGYPTIDNFILDTIGRKLYWEEHIRFHGYRINTLRADLDGSNIEEIDLLPPRGSAFDPADGKVYWTDGYMMRRADYDGLHVDGFKMEGVEDLVRVSQPFRPRGIALDAVRRKVYWTDEGKQTIDRADLDGSNAETVVEGLLDPKGIDVDGTRGKMYWTEHGRIGRADLDGSNAEVLIEGLSRPYGIEIDGASGRVYWTDQTGILRANLNGSNAEVVVRLEPSGGRRIAIDGVGGKMYWTHEYWIQRADLSGANIEIFLPEETVIFRDIHIGTPASIAVDPVGRELYWSAYELDDPYTDYVGFTGMKKASLDDDSAAAEFVGPFSLAEDIVLYLPESIPTYASISRTSFEAPAESRLGPSYPNPFNAGTRIAYRIAESGPVRLVVYSLLGQPVRTLVNQVQNAGSYEVRWDAQSQQGTTVASGVYLARLHHPGGVQSLRLLFLR